MTPADQAITQSVTNSLAAAGITTQTMNRIQVHAVNGRVILMGDVSSQTERQTIEARARQTPGVRTVINQLRVAVGTEPGNTAPGATPDAEKEVGSPESPSSPAPR